VSAFFVRRFIAWRMALPNMLGRHEDGLIFLVADTLKDEEVKSCQCCWMP
jgi:hypothetical protein